MILENVKKNTSCSSKDLISKDDLFEMVAGDLLKDYVTALLGDLKNRERERYGVGGTEETI